MPLSGRYKELRTRLNELKDHMLPRIFSPTGEYTERQEDRARGYRLLAHAEIEAYLEDIAREKVTDAIREWKSGKKFSEVIVSLLACFHTGWSLYDASKNETIIELAKSRSKKSLNSVNDVIDLAQQQYTQRLKENHGIKRKNLATVISPTGVATESLDETWLTNLDSFGHKRGEVAHNTKRTQAAINPQDELSAVRTILIGLEELDRRIQSIV